MIKPPPLNLSGLLLLFKYKKDADLTGLIDAIPCDIQSGESGNQENQSQ